MKKRGGTVVSFASISAGVAQSGRWLYPITKAAMQQSPAAPRLGVITAEQAVKDPFALESVLASGAAPRDTLAVS